MKLNAFASGFNDKACLAFSNSEYSCGDEEDVDENTEFLPEDSCEVADVKDGDRVSPVEVVDRVP